MALALFNLGTHMSFIKAYQKGDASKIAVWEYTYLPMVSAMAFFVFDEVPEMPVITGMLLIIVAGILSLNSQKFQSALKKSLRI